MHPISPQLVRKFNHAARLSREGRHEDALATWDAMLRPSSAHPRGDEPPWVVTGRFLALSAMRRAWVLMDLRRFEDARAALEGSLLRTLLPQLHVEERYDYWFSLGNTLGELAEIEAMDAALTQALVLAAEQLGCRRRTARAWTRLLDCCARHGAWQQLSQESGTAQLYARNSGDVQLFTKATWRRAEALRALGRREEARDQARMLLELAQQADSQPCVQRVRRLLESL